MNRKLNQKRFKFLRVYVSCVKEGSGRDFSLGFWAAWPPRTQLLPFCSAILSTGSVFKVSSWWEMAAGMLAITSPFFTVVKMKNRRRRDGKQESTIWTPYSLASVSACLELRLLLALGVSALLLCVFSSSCGFLSLQPKEPFGMMTPSSGTLVQSLFCISQGLKFRFNVLT